MSLTYVQADDVTLAEVGHDERWLQARILDDASILGLGDLNVIERERKQPSGGRIDFLMSDPETNTMYEVEVMLGTLDESHIIRTIEYWDIERRRAPNRDHVAVIVAEDITNRFFNVIGLLNRSVPIIAIQLTALRFEDKLVLKFIRVLDVYEQTDYEEEDAEPSDRAWWEGRSEPQSLAIVDACAELLAANGRSPRLTYNQNHIAMGGVRQNFAWFRPRKQKRHCFIEIKPSDGAREELSAQLEEAGITLGSARRNLIRIKLTARELEDQKALIHELLSQAANTTGGGL